MGWIIFWSAASVWLVGVLLTWRPFAISLLEGIERTGAGLPLDGGDRVFAAFTATWLALGWPITMPGRVIYRKMSGAQILRTPKERAAAERKELAQLRKLACEHGLPLPEPGDGVGHGHE
jgi:hypothetical protein